MTPKVRVGLHRTLTLQDIPFFCNLFTPIQDVNNKKKQILADNAESQVVCTEIGREIKKSSPLLNQLNEFYKKGGVQISLYGKLVSLLKLRGAPK